MLKGLTETQLMVQRDLGEPAALQGNRLPRFWFVASTGCLDRMATVRSNVATKWGEDPLCARFVRNF